MAMDGKRGVAGALAVLLWCSLPSVRAAPDAGVRRQESIDERIAEIIFQSPGLKGGGWDDELWENKSMLEIVHNPTRYESDIEEYLLSRSRDKNDETRVAVLALQCLPLQRYTKFVTPPRWSRHGCRGQGASERWNTRFSGRALFLLMSSS